MYIIHRFKLSSRADSTVIYVPAMASVSTEAVQSGPKPSATLRRITIRDPPFTYLHLSLLTSSTSPPPLDILTARLHLNSAISQFLGITGSAIPIDFLKVEGRDVWVRVPREDAAAVVGALSRWIGRDGGFSWRVKRKGEWLGVVAAGDGQMLFES